MSSPTSPQLPPLLQLIGPSSKRLESLLAYWLHRQAPALTPQVLLCANSLSVMPWQSSLETSPPSLIDWAQNYANHQPETATWDAAHGEAVDWALSELIIGQTVANRPDTGIEDPIDNLLDKIDQWVFGDKHQWDNLPEVAKPALSYGAPRLMEQYPTVIFWQTIPSALSPFLAAEKSVQPLLWITSEQTELPTLLESPRTPLVILETPETNELSPLQQTLLKEMDEGRYQLIGRLTTAMVHSDNPQALHQRFTAMMTHLGWE